MKTLYIWIVIMMAFQGCQYGMGDPFESCYDNDKPVSLDKVLGVYERYERASLEGTELDLFCEFYGHENQAVLNSYWIASDTAFAVQLPHYATSNHPFLANAEVFYNACLLAFNVWSNHDLWLRENESEELVDPSKVIEGIKSVNEACIRDTALCEAARIFKDSLFTVMRQPVDAWEEDKYSMDFLFNFAHEIELKVPKFYKSESQFADSLADMYSKLIEPTKHITDLYENVDENQRVKMILSCLNNCSTFDQQCSLLLNWANTPTAEMDDEWVVAVAHRLLESGKYNPCLNNIWIIWRCLFQYCYVGISRDSPIPNDMYNQIRKQCYLTCLKRIEKHPRDVFAMNCASALAGRMNINRMGENAFGNDAVIEKYTYLVGRYQIDDEVPEDCEVSHEECD